MYMTPSRISLLVLAVILMLVIGSGSASGREQKNVEHLSYLPFIVQPVPRVEDINEPLLIEGVEGRIYARATVDGLPKTVVLATDDGRFLDSYPFAGRLALDRNNHKLLIDQGEKGIVVLNSLSGEQLGVINVPGSGPPPADPQVDSSRGVAYAFRSNTVYMLDIEEMMVTDSHTLSVPLEVCDTPQGEAPITRSFFDLISSTIYISFNTWKCTPYLIDTIYIYDAVSWHEWGKYSTPSQYQAIPYAGNLYGMSYLSTLGTHAFWAHSLTEDWYEESGAGDIVALTGSVVDWSRALLYEAAWITFPGGDVDKQIRISSTATRLALATISYDVSPIQEARLAGHDPHTDQLYFLDHGLIIVIPTTSILPVD
ncbi:MAG TPA: hypothetical protein VLE70_21790 [Anaerolineae bacterium]|jgi:hypothetical protein|nr:hypothetical protein [Anaerolineae bacterium]